VRAPSARAIRAVYNEGPPGAQPPPGV